MIRRTRAGLQICTVQDFQVDADAWVRFSVKEAERLAHFLRMSGTAETLRRGDVVLAGEAAAKGAFTNEGPVPGVFFWDPFSSPPLLMAETHVDPRGVPPFEVGPASFPPGYWYDLGYTVVKHAPEARSYWESMGVQVVDEDPAETHKDTCHVSIFPELEPRRQPGCIYVLHH